jgi:hypothetical protein
MLQVVSLSFSTHNSVGLESYEQKISHLKALYHLACADNVFSKAEAVYIQKVAEKLGIDVAELAKFEKTEPKLHLPDREFKIYALFHRLAIIIMVDDGINEQEKRYCFNLGIKMGLHPNAVGEIIEYVIEHGAMQTSPKEVMNIFRKYLS